MHIPEAAGHRHILLSDHMWFSEISKIIASKFSPMGYSVPTSELPNFMLKAFSWLDKSVRVLVPLLGIKLELDNHRMTDVLGVKPRPARETIIDMCHSLIDLGIVKKLQGYKPKETEEK